MRKLAFITFQSGDFFNKNVASRRSGAVSSSRMLRKSKRGRVKTTAPQPHAVHPRELTGERARHVEPSLAILSQQHTHHSLVLRVVLSFFCFMGRLRVEGWGLERNEGPARQSFCFFHRLQGFGSNQGTAIDAQPHGETHETITSRSRSRASAPLRRGESGPPLTAAPAGAPPTHRVGTFHAHVQSCSQNTTV